jgi:hypothetical protein
MRRVDWDVIMIVGLAAIFAAFIAFMLYLDHQKDMEKLRRQPLIEESK